MKSSRKGGDNERKKAKEWSLWFSQGEREDLIWRVGGSGGRATVRSKHNKITAASYGDLTFTDPVAEPLFRVCTIELKKGYKKLDWLSFLDGKGKRNLLHSFLEKVSNDAIKAAQAGWGSNPVLVTHRDRKVPLITLRSDLFNSISNYCGNLCSDKITISIDNVCWITLRLKDFFNWCNPKFFEWNLNEKHNYL